MLLFTLLTTLGPVVPILVLLFPSLLKDDLLISSFPDLRFILPLTILVLLVIIRLLFALVSRQSVMKNMLFWPQQHLNLLLLVLRNLKFRSGGVLDWKGRSIKTKS